MTHPYWSMVRKHKGACVECGKSVWTSRNGDSNIAYVAEQGGAKTCLDCAVCAHDISFKAPCQDCAADVAELGLFG